MIIYCLNQIITILYLLLFYRPVKEKELSVSEPTAEPHNKIIEKHHNKSYFFMLEDIPINKKSIIFIYQLI